MLQKVSYFRLSSQIRKDRLCKDPFCDLDGIPNPKAKKVKEVKQVNEVKIDCIWCKQLATGSCFNKLVPRMVPRKHIPSKSIVVDWTSFAILLILFFGLEFVFNAYLR